MRASGWAGATVAALLAVAVSGCGSAVASPALGTTSPVGDSPGAASSPSPAPPPSSDDPGTASRCSSSQVALTAATDRPSYPPGTPVTVTTTVSNHSTQPCVIALSAHNPAYSVTGGSGMVWRSCGPGTTCPLYERLVMLPAGQSRTESMTWNRRTCTDSSCSGPPPPAGAYTATASWGELGSASAPFTLS